MLAVDAVFVVNGIVIGDFSELRERLAFSAASGSDGSRNHFSLIDGRWAMPSCLKHGYFVAERVNRDLCWASGPDCLKSCICLLWPGLCCPCYQAVPFYVSQTPCATDL